MKSPKPLSRRAALLVVALLALILVLMFVALQAARDAALHPVAERLGTQASYWAVVDKMTSELNSRKGQSRADVHAFLDGFGRASYLGPYPSQGGTRENVTWVPVNIPFGLGTATIWDLSYDSSGRLVRVELVDAP